MFHYIASRMFFFLPVLDPQFSHTETFSPVVLQIRTEEKERSSTYMYFTVYNSYISQYVSCHGFKLELNYCLVNFLFLLQVSEVLSKGIRLYLVCQTKQHGFFWLHINKGKSSSCMPPVFDITKNNGHDIYYLRGEKFVRLPRSLFPSNLYTPQTLRMSTYIWKVFPSLVNKEGFPQHSN